MSQGERAKVTLSLTAEALEQLTTERKRGEFVNRLVMAAYQTRLQASERLLHPAEVAERLQELAALLAGQALAI